MDVGTEARMEDSRRYSQRRLHTGVWILGQHALIHPRIHQPTDTYPYRMRSKRLGESRHNSTRQPCASVTGAVREQLKQCPEAFKVGEILSKAFDSLKYTQNESEIGDRYLPPASVVIPPLV